MQDAFYRWAAPSPAALEDLCTPKMGERSITSTSSGGIVRVRSKTTMLMPNAAEQHRQLPHHYGGDGAARSPFNHSFLSRQHQISVSNTHDLRRR